MRSHLRILLPIVVGLMFTLGLSGVASASAVRLIHRIWFVQVDEPTWMHTSAPVSLGVRTTHWEMAYGMLDSEKVNSPGDRVSLEYRLRSEGFGPYARLEADRYRRGNNGGISVSLGVQVRVAKSAVLRVGAQQGWTTGPVLPAVSILLEAKI
jgi:hypothetical protein